MSNAMCTFFFYPHSLEVDQCVFSINSVLLEFPLAPSKKLIESETNCEL